jgi:uncharacterized membrane protein
MAAGARWGGRLWSAVGLSLLGATAHAVVQLVAVDRVLAPGGAVLALLPLFLSLALLTGLATGLVAEMLLRRLRVARAPLPGGP